MQLGNSSLPVNSKKYNNGPYIAQVVSHLDPEKMGALEVILLKGTASGMEAADNVKIVAHYAPSFFGNTPYAAMDPSNRNSSSTQASYGMWFVPPDVNTWVLVVFVEGDPNRCYWIGCVPQPGINHMVPGLASSKYAELTPQEKTKLGTDDVPVSEVNRRLTKLRTDDIDKVKRPMHPFALRLATQGLLKDPIRGTTTSSARRHAISNVYGISTPGPPVLNKKYSVGPDKDKFEVYTEREGGTQFVMDDGEISKDQKTGKIGITDELVRIRTRTGHQILLHNSADLIYICNSRGTAWIEFTSDGKIDVFAADSVSIHTEEDFNFRADRDVNIEAGRNVNMAAIGNIHMETGGLLEGYAGLDCNWTGANHVNLTALGRVRITSTGASVNPTHAGPLSGIDIYSVLGNVNMYATTEIKMQTLDELDLKAGLAMNFISGASTTFKTVGSFNVDTGGGNYITAVGANVFRAGGAHVERASLIDMNGPTPAPTSPTAATDLAIALDLLALLPESGTSVTLLDRFTLPYREADKNATADMQKGWENNNYYATTKIRSIMLRVPTHEPYDHHESVDPAAFKPEKTDRGG